MHGLVLSVMGEQKNKWRFGHTNAIPISLKRKLELGDVKSFAGCRLVSGRKREQTQVGLTTQRGHCLCPVQKGRFFSASTEDPLEVWSQGVT